MLLLEGHTSPVYALAFSPDGRYLASGTKAGTVWVWDEGGGREEYAAAFPDPQPVNSFDWQPGQGLLAVATEYGCFVGLPQRDQAPVWGQRDRATAARFLSPTLLAVGFGHRDKPESGSLEIWDLAADRRREPYFPAPQGVRSVAALPDRKLVAWAEWGRRVSVWEITKPEPIRFNLPQDSPSVALHPDGAQLAAALDRDVAVFDLTRPNERLLNAGRAERFRLKGHKGRVTGVAYSPDGRTLATGSWDGTVRLWDSATGAERACFLWPVGRVYAVTYSPDGLRLAAGGERGSVILWDVG